MSAPTGANLLFTLAIASRAPRFTPSNPCANRGARSSNSSAMTPTLKSAGAEPGTATMDVASSDDSSSLLPQTSLQAERFPGTGVNRTEEVEVRPLDQVFASQQLPGPVLLKIETIASIDLLSIWLKSSKLPSMNWICALSPGSGSPRRIASAALTI